MKFKTKNVTTALLLISFSLSFTSLYAQTGSKNKLTNSEFSLENLAKDTINQSFKGVPLTDFITKVDKRLDITKGEFETSDDFTKRLEAAAKSITINGYTLQAPIAVVVNVENNIDPTISVGYSYSADSEELLLSVLAKNKKLINHRMPTPGAPDPDDTADIFDISREWEKETHYIASNAFGATVKVKKQDIKKYGLISSRIDWLTFERKPLYLLNAPTVARISLPPASASKILPKLSAILVIQPKPPYIAYDYDKQFPTRDIPTERAIRSKYLTGELLGIVFYSRSDGKVIYRLPEGFGIQNN